MITDRTLENLFLGLSDELACWALAGEGLQHLAGQLLSSHPNSLDALVEVQQLDALVQHIEQMAVLCGRLSEAAAANGGVLDIGRVRMAAEASTLSGLSQRFHAGGRPMAPASTGECELW
ncbi:hypothetical protein BZG35_13610 [Brevundimonas sp. LM2]|uniref:hypothetical protein n=1 Tax=Brevundimonas sp. LM2 TaxID=1938605 RepID=UPI000983A054|nr:hypothetical protein [Brevundimonas sp. LM2]AQR62567.1 hypothetical protein BZG35_13610 [Brevundimonas sp. LM2]